MYKVSKIVGEYCMAHYVDSLPDTHQCRRIHGHNNLVTLIVTAKDVSKKTGFVFDLKKLNLLDTVLKQAFDHRFININHQASNIDKDMQGLLHNFNEYLTNPTTEAFAKSIAVMLTGTDWATVLFEDNIDNMCSIEVVVQETGLKKLSASYTVYLKPKTEV